MSAGSPGKGIGLHQPLHPPGVWSWGQGGPAGSGTDSESVVQNYCSQRTVKKDGMNELPR